MIVGPGFDAGDADLLRAVQQAGIAGRVSFLGERDDIPELIAALDVAALPSAWGEGFPNVLGEAMASGVACVATDIGDSAWIVGRAGLIVPPRDAEALAEALGQPGRARARRTAAARRCGARPRDRGVRGRGDRASVRDAVRAGDRQLARGGHGVMAPARPTKSSGAAAGSAKSMTSLARSARKAPAKPPLSVLHAITGLAIGGAEIMLYRLLQGSDRRRFASTVLALMTPGAVGGRIAALDVPIVSLNMREGRPLAPSILSVGRIARAVAPDILQGWMYHGNLTATLAWWHLKRRGPLVWSVHHSLADISCEKLSTRMAVRLNAALSRLPDAIIYCSRQGVRQHEAVGFAGNKSEVIPNGFDCDHSRPDPAAKGRLCQMLGIEPDRIVVGMVTRAHPMKDHAESDQGGRRPVGQAVRAASGPARAWRRCAGWQDRANGTRGRDRRSRDAPGGARGRPPDPVWPGHRGLPVGVGRGVPLDRRAKRWRAACRAW